MAINSDDDDTIHIVQETKTTKQHPGFNGRNVAVSQVLIKSNRQEFNDDVTTVNDSKRSKSLESSHDAFEFHNQLANSKRKEFNYGLLML